MRLIAALAVLVVTSCKPEFTTPGEAANLTRACIPDTAASIILDATTGADDDSGALDAWEVYRMDCDTDAWVKWGTSAVNAAADDQVKIFAGVPEYFATNETILHVSAKSVTANGDCRILKCK